MKESYPFELTLESLTKNLGLFETSAKLIIDFIDSLFFEAYLSLLAIFFIYGAGLLSMFPVSIWA